MILVFGGTTEGRLAAEVLDEAGSEFYYSTKGDMQQVQMRNGKRLSGAMDVVQMRDFCTANDIRLLVDAAHPFAENLHKTIAEVGLPVIRLQRDFGKRIPEVRYCSTFNEAMGQMEADSISRLLALSGANTIAKLINYWSNHTTFFRILNREESIEMAKRQCFPLNNLIFYSNDNTLPDVEAERAMMKQLNCDAIITKESGASGGFAEKVQAALSLRMKVYAIEHPRLPESWHYVTGRWGLRRAVEKLAPGFYPLRSGFTTGACATAATKAALLSLLYDELPDEVHFALADGEVMHMPVGCKERGTASVVKDFSDDPDVTKGCRITAKVVRGHCGIRFFGGEGIGTVTLPGLGLEVGEPAINVTPRRMIEAEIRSLSDDDFDVTLSIENGAEIAKKTFNERVGVVGGLSIIGTSGIVRPLSNEAFVESIRRELEVAYAMGKDTVGLVSGMRSEKQLQEMYPELRCIHYGNFVGAALDAAHSVGIKNVIVGIMLGKAVKLAEGNLDTHSHKVAMNKGFLCTLAKSANCSEDALVAINEVTLANELWDRMSAKDLNNFINALENSCKKICTAAFPAGNVTVHIIKGK